jgi:hypothetical protein
MASDGVTVLTTRRIPLHHTDHPGWLVTLRLGRP